MDETKKLLSKTFLANLFNFVLRLILTFLLGDILGFDYKIYYPLLLIFLISVGYLVHAKFVFKQISFISGIKYLIHLLFFNYVDYIMFEILILNFINYQVVATSLVTVTLFLFRFFSLNKFVFRENS